MKTAYDMEVVRLYKLSAVGLGIARGEIDDFIELALNKPITFKSPAAGKAMLRDETYAQRTVGRISAAEEVSEQRTTREASFRAKPISLREDTVL